MVNGITARYSAAMGKPYSHTEKVAASLLNRSGLALIWDLHLSAAKAHCNGRGLAAR